jgi:sugar lactone lactonase YvrE
MGLAASAASIVETDSAKPVRASVEFDLPADGLTSGGVFRPDGELVRQLWAMKRLTAGKHRAGWDGMDGFGQQVPAGEYEVRVILNNSVYRNVGAIGNSGQPTTTFGCIPVNFESLALDREGFVYSVQDWDEAHRDIIRWDPQTGHVQAHSGHPVEGILKAIALDDEYAYVTAWSGNPHSPEERANSFKLAISRVRIDRTAGSRRWERIPFTAAGDEIVVYRGGTVIPAGTPPADAEAMIIPLLSIAVRGDRLLVTDALAGRVRAYDKVTGEPKGGFPVPLAQCLAVAPDGRLWVGHGHAKVSVFAPDGTPVATPIRDLANVRSLTFGPDGRLYVADQGAAQVKVYAVKGNQVRKVGTLGDKARPGDRAPNRFHDLASVAVDAQGNVFTAQREEAMYGGRLAKFSPKGKALWEQLGLEFCSTAAYGEHAPDIVHASSRHAYRVDKQAGTWNYLGNTLIHNSQFWTAAGRTWIRQIDGQEFHFSCSGDGLQVYRATPAKDASSGPVLTLVSILGRNRPLPDGRKPDDGWRKENHYLWSWHNESSALPTPATVTLNSTPESDRALWQYGAWTVAADNSVWIASYDRGGDTPEKESVWMVPMRGLNQQGNPVYDWADAVCRIPRRAMLPPGGPLDKLEPRIVQHGEDGMTYLYAITPWPGAHQSGGLHMGGNILAGFAGEVARWRTVLPETCVGLAAIPGGQGGVLVGGQPHGGIIHHYTADGLLIGSFGPDQARLGGPPDNHTTGLMDMFGALNACRDPRDGLVDVFVEDNYNLRVIWHRFDDRDIRTVSAKVILP